VTLPLGRLSRDELPQVCASTLRRGRGADGDMTVYTAMQIMLLNHSMFVMSVDQLRLMTLPMYRQKPMQGQMLRKQHA